MTTRKNFFKIASFLFVILSAFLFFNKGAVSQKCLNCLSVHLDYQTIKKGYTIQSRDQNLLIGIWPKITNQEITITVADMGQKNIKVPETKNLISHLYVYDILGEKPVHFEGAYTLALKYQSEERNKKAIYFYNPALNKWSEVAPAQILPDSKIIRVRLNIPYAMLAVLEEKTIKGQASWYRYKGCNCAASPIYPKGTLLKVTNLDNGESVVVKVNDYGPDRSIYPNRIIDLDLTAFRQIGNPKHGIIDVSVGKIQ